MKRTILLAVVWSVGMSAEAADYPVRPIRLIVPFGAGSISDIMARTVSIRLSETLQQQVIIDNRPGAGGNIGGQAAAQATPDGYTIMVAPASVLAINRSLYSSIPYDSATAFSPVARMSTNCNVLVVNPSLPARSVKELIEYVKSNSGKVNFASTGAGGTIHLSGEMFKWMTGTDMTHIVYKASPLAHIDIFSGQVHLMFDSIPTALPQIKAGKLRALGVTDSKRSLLLPDLPTIAESGLPGYRAVNFYGFVAPAGTPPHVISKLSEKIVDTLNDKEVRNQLLSRGAEPAPGGPEELQKLVSTEAERWAKMIKAIGLRLD